MPFPFLLILLVAALLLQTSVLEVVSVAGVKPDLVMLIVVLNGFLLGPREGAFLGYIGGIVEDLFLGEYIGLNAISKMAAGYLAGVAGERLYKENTLVATGVTFFSAAAGLLVNYLLLFFLDLHVSPFYALLRLALPTALYTALLAPFIFGRIFRYFQVRSKDF
ncbi:MAG: rod shape-determining protein MreD [Desulfotomaculaceae bacterium]|nr:rod shape-determining protein MreD [Desulfotomaculaceae bacterium]